MVIVFDLDDTLFDELSFVYSGFQAVAKHLSKVLSLPAEKIFQGLKKQLKIKREQVFDRFLMEHGIQNKKLVKECLSIYRKHTPTIALFPEAKQCIERFKHLPLYVVTDGNKLVQRRKFEALGLKRQIKRCFCTHAFGVKYAKPSSYCFQKISQVEKTPPECIVYIADNPTKDFVGLQAAGFKTIRVLTGQYRHLNASPKHDADITIKSLKQLTPNFLERVFS